METYKITATQILLPYGKRCTVYGPICLEREADYTAMLEAGFGIEMEMLTTGEVSITISSEHEDVDIRVVSNGPSVRAAIESMLEARLWESVTA